MIVATAGHVDHGKTSLIKQLTGVDTDRLEEEKRRGLTINLGFAYRKLEGRAPIGFVDVPGHHRFINTMIAGVSGIDLGMLVVAADDGPMPQTREHLDVLRLLGVQHIIVVITKIDRVSASRIEEVAAQSKALVAGSEGTTPTFQVSNLSGDGVSALLSYLQQCASDVRSRSQSGGFRLSIDRAFTLKGVGLVLTGTVTAGSVGIGESLILQPAGVKLRVRGIHVQDEKSESACAGQRCALNVVGAVSRVEVARGDWLLDANAGPLSHCIDARIQLLDTVPFPLKHLSPIKIYLGARRIAGRVFLLEGGNRLVAGGGGLVQLLLNEAISCCHGERFLVRDDSESVTLGGGIVLDPYARRSGKSQPQRLRALAALETDSPSKALVSMTAELGALVDLEEFRRGWNLRSEEMQVLCEALVHVFDANGSRYGVGEARWQQGVAAVLDALESWHQTHPYEPGIAIGALEAQMRKILELPLFTALLGPLTDSKKICLRKGVLYLHGFKPLVSAEDVERWQKIESLLRRQGKDIPLLSQITAATGLRRKSLERLLRRAVHDGKVHRLNENRFASSEQLAKLAQQVCELGAEGEAITVVSVKERLGIGRKLAIEVLEYFDSIGFTRREQDQRLIVGAEQPALEFCGDSANA